MPEIKTARLHLRMLTPADLDDLARIFSDPEVVRHIGTGQPASRAETETALLSILRHWEQHGFGRWAVVHQGHGRLIGYGGLRSLYGTPEVVYLLDKAYWGQGLATEIARASLKYGFEELSSERIVALTKPENVASQRVLEKIGMGYQGPAHYFNMDVLSFEMWRAGYRPDDSPYALRKG